MTFFRDMRFRPDAVRFPRSVITPMMRAPQVPPGASDPEASLRALVGQIIAAREAIRLQARFVSLIEQRHGINDSTRAMRAALTQLATEVAAASQWIDEQLRRQGEPELDTQEAGAGLIRVVQVLIATVGAVAAVTLISDRFNAEATRRHQLTLEAASQAAQQGYAREWAEAVATVRESGGSGWGSLLGGGMAALLLGGLALVLLLRPRRNAA